VIIIKDKFWGPFLERFSGRDELEEMAGLKKPDSGLPVNLWLDDSHAYIHGRHAKRIKFQGDYGNNTNRTNLFSMTISKDDPQIPVKQLPKLKLPSKDIDKIKIFVKNNADLLNKLADEKISFMVFTRQMKV
jgi:Flp pilus assembly CpaF family ATPase